jgi:hypothetical protein
VDLIERWKQHEQHDFAWIGEIMSNLEQNNGKAFSSGDLDLIKRRIEGFTKALQRMFKLKIPLLKVDSSFFNTDVNQVDNNDDVTDPPLAVLFKRIGTGGTPLSDADYAYSVIKNQIPKSYALVETLHSKGNIAGLLSATDLVMSAVRLAASEYESDKKTITDRESPTKQEFHRLIKQDGFLQNQFLPLIEQGILDSVFTTLTKLLEYSEQNKNGIPLHAFPLLNRPLIQVLLRWLRCIQLHPSTNDLITVANQSRDEVLRFVMYWQLCVHAPKEASVVAYKHLKNGVTQFPAQEIYKALLTEQRAIPIIDPETIEQIKPDMICSPVLKKLRGLERFDTGDTTDEQKGVIALYQRWWGNGQRYQHPLLLWLQRETVNQFEGSPVAGRDEDTPYDYDHICPSNYWSNWTGGII